MSKGRRIAERLRLEEAAAGKKWRRWGTYLSERQWGTVREDYSENGDAWGYLSHEDACFRTYRWGEGSHGEDVKELYYYLDATPTHSYAKALYKYPHEAFPYEALRRMAREAGRG